MDTSIKPILCPRKSGPTQYHQGVSWDFDIEQKNLKKKMAKLHGVAMTVAGSELSRVVIPEPMTSYTEALRAYLLRSFGIKMKQVEATGA